MLFASTAYASTDDGALRRSHSMVVDILYPELPVDGDGWRGLLPVILYDTDKLAGHYGTTDAPSKRSERREQH